MKYLTLNPIVIDDLLRSLKFPETGAMVTFSGITRGRNRGKEVIRLEYEAQPSMANKVIEEIILKAKNKWDLNDIICIHRIGTVLPTETSILIITTAAHRKNAYEANQFIIDQIKKDVPIWKNEFFSDGSSSYGKSEALLKA